MGSKQLDTAAIPCALYACIASTAIFYLRGGLGNWHGTLLDVSYRLLEGQAGMPRQAWRMAQNAGAVQLTADAVSHKTHLCPSSH